MHLLFRIVTNINFVTDAKFHFLFQLICGTEIRNISFNGKFFLVAYDAAVRDVSKERNCLHSQGV